MMKTLMGLGAAFLIGWSAASGAYGHDPAPTHSCPRPLKPFRFESQLDVNQFKEAVNHYETCLKDFVKDQEQFIQQHKQAMQQAVEEWNIFVRTELQQE